MQTGGLEVFCVAGARPNFVKIAPLISELRRRPEIRVRLIHTGQHFSPEMSKIFFEDLEMPEPDINLACGGGSHTAQTAEIMKRIEPVLEEVPCDVLVVVGDVNSTLAAALVASKMGIPIAHVEAGLRSFDRHMPEEINRILTDAISDVLFVTEPSARDNLLAEGVSPERIHFVGNVMIDTLLRSRAKADSSDVLTRLRLAPKQYGVITLHRPSNVDHIDQLSSLLGTLGQVSRNLPIVFPVHPRTKARLQQAGALAATIILTEPLGYLDFIKLTAESRLVMTDSGGIQEETTILGVPCLTLRENTERPITIEKGTNLLIGTDRRAILDAVERILRGQPAQNRIPELWDGKASHRIADVLEKTFPRNRMLEPVLEAAG